MKFEIIEKIFSYHNVGEVTNFEKISIGFTNEIYSVDDLYIVKICRYENNREEFEREYKLYNYFEDIINVPKTCVYDNSKNLIDKDFMVYRKIDGDNLYSLWHTYSVEERRSIIQELCDILKKINSIPLSEVPHIFPNTNINWKENYLSNFNTLITKVKQKDILQEEIIEKLINVVDNNSYVLEEQKIALTYFDAHFDNILVKEGKIVGFLDFERTDLCSIDFTLDLIQRMQNYPSKYPAEQWEKYIQKDDYSNLLSWFEEFYPELFQFKELEKRLDLYSLEHDLDTLISFPQSKETKEMTLRVLDKY